MNTISVDYNDVGSRGDFVKQGATCKHQQKNEELENLRKVAKSKTSRAENQLKDAEFDDYDWLVVRPIRCFKNL